MFREPKTLTIIDMLNKIRASGKPVKIETLNQAPDHNIEENQTPRHGIKDIASDGNGVYLLETSSACYKVDKDGVSTTEERNQLIPLAAISRIILS